MTVLSLDLGTSTGWAIQKPDNSIVSGTEALVPENTVDRDVRYWAFQQWLYRIITQIPDIQCVYYEIVRRHLGTYAAHVYGGYRGILLAWAYDNNIPCFFLPPSTIKKYITGKGNASKQEVIQAVQCRGFSPKDDNEADALALLLLALEVGRRNKCSG